MGNHLRSIVLVFFCYTYVQAQVGPPPGLTAEEAPLIDCYLPGYAQATNILPNDQDWPPPFCGSVENNQWMAFTAKSGTYIFTIEVGNCQNGNGLQAMVFGLSGNCPYFPGDFIPMSNCVDPGTETTLEVIATNLNYNEVYYLMIDGWAGDICDYTIVEVEKLDPYDPEEPFIDGPTTVQAGQPGAYTIVFPPAPPHINPCYNFPDTICSSACISSIDDYSVTWTGPPGSQVAIGPNLYSCVILFGDQGGLVTAQLVGPCFSLTLELEVVVEVYVYQSHCQGDGPFSYCGQPLFGSGTYSCQIDTYTMEILNLMVFPFQQLFYQEEICAGECVTVEGTEVCGGGTHIVPFVDDVGCYAEFVIEVEEITAEASLPPADTLSPDNPSIVLPGYNPNNSPEVIYEWTGPGITPDIANEPSPEISLPGWYHLGVYHPTLGCYSSDLIIIYYDSNCVPDTPVAPSDSCWAAPSFCSTYLDGFCSSTAGYSADTAGNLNTVLN
ncbi:MAG: hypothetical protein KDC44_17000, partial [Phaeodactylibacter sp.]|nr:hypothetical protein [Phaeodactylibacter sp.]